VVLLALAGVGAVGRIGKLAPQYRYARDAEHNFSVLDRAITVAGGPATIMRCGRGLVAVNHSSQTALAWKLHVELKKVRPYLRHPGIVFRGPHVETVGAPAELSYKPHARFFYDIGRAGPWHVFGILPRGARPGPGCPHV
jgi:hypothetical protein